MVSEAYASLEIDASTGFRRVEGLKEVLLIGFCESVHSRVYTGLIYSLYLDSTDDDAILQPFIKAANVDFPNLTIR